MEIGFSVRALTTTEIPRVRREELIMGVIFHLKNIFTLERWNFWKHWKQTVISLHSFCMPGDESTNNEHIPQNII